MTTVISADRTTRVDLVSEEGWILQEGVDLIPNDPTAAMLGSDIASNFIQIYGHILTTESGLDFPTAILIDGASTYNSIYVGKAGTIMAANNGIEVHGENNSVVNDGSIDAWGGAGVMLSGLGSALVNRGSIMGYAAGVFVEGGGNTVTNYGDIGLSSLASSPKPGIAIASLVGEVNFVYNHGDISALGNAIEGGDGDEQIENSGKITGGIAVGAGNDTVDNSAGTIRGFVDLGDGDDTYIGGTNERTTNVAGGIGSDTYFLQGGLSEIIEDVGGGTADTVIIDVSAALAKNIEILTLAGGDDINGAGNVLDNIIFGNGGDNRLRGNGGSDVLLGGYGEDRLNGGAGLDFASYQYSEEGVSVDLGKKTASGGDADGDTFLSIENLVGSAFVDMLTGDTGANKIQGFSGSDTINGGKGNDTLEGGDGNDKFIFAKKTGQDTVEDFTLSGINSDRIDVHAFKPKSFADLQSHMADDGADVEITYGKDVLTLVGIHKADLTIDHFIL